MNGAHQVSDERHTPHVRAPDMAKGAARAERAHAANRARIESSSPSLDGTSANATNLEQRERDRALDAAFCDALSQARQPSCSSFERGRRAGCCRARVG